MFEDLMKDKTFPTKKKRKPHKPQDQTFSPNIVFSCHAQKAVAKQSDICLWYAKMLDETSKDIEKKFWEKRLSGKTCSSDTMLNENVWSFSRSFVTPLGTLEGTEEWATKNMQLVLQHCCKTSWLEILRVLSLTSNMLCNKSGCCVLPRGW